MVILENIDIDKTILQNIDIDKILNRFKFGISNRARGTPSYPRLRKFYTTPDPEFFWGSVVHP